MLRLVLGAIPVYGALLIAALVVDSDLLDAETNELASVALSAFMVPVLATWLVAELINWVSPRRLFDPRVAGALPRIARGFVGAALGAIIAALGLALLDTALPDALITGSSAAGAAAIVLLPLAHARRGHCIHCGYDLSGACISTGRTEPATKPVCPECGRDVLLAIIGARAAGAPR